MDKYSVNNLEDLAFPIGESNEWCEPVSDEDYAKL